MGKERGGQTPQRIIEWFSYVYGEAMFTHNRNAEGHSKHKGRYRVKPGGGRKRIKKTRSERWVLVQRSPEDWGRGPYKWVNLQWLGKTGTRVGLPKRRQKKKEKTKRNASSLRISIRYALWVPNQSSWVCPPKA